MSVPSSPAPWVYWHRTPLVQGTGWAGDVAIDPFNSSVVWHNTGQGLWACHDVTEADHGRPTHWDFSNEGLEETVW